MDMNGRRGYKRPFADRGAPFLSSWVDSRPYPQYGLSPELASDVPHLTTPLYPSDAPLYTDTAGKLVFVNPEPVMYSSPYLPSSALPPGVSAFPPSGSHLLGVNNAGVFTHNNGYLPVDDYLQPLNPIVHSHQLAPIEVHEPLTRFGEYSLAPPFHDHYSQLPPRSDLSRGSLPARRRAAPPKGRLPPRDRSPPRLSRPQKRQRDRSPPSLRVPQKKKQDTLPVVTTKSKGKKKSKKNPAGAEQRKEAKVVKQDTATDATAKNAKGTKTENPTVENPIAGMIFGCNDQTEKECRRLQLFGLPAVRKNDVLRVIPGSKLFLFNFNSKELSGVYEAVTHGALDIVPNAFQSYGSFPAQVRTKRIMRASNLPFKTFKKAIKENFYSDRKFNYELSASQVEKLVELFASTKGEAID